MKWKSALTVEEAVLAVMGYKEGDFAYISLDKEIIHDFEGRGVDEKASAWFYESIEIYEALMADAFVEIDEESRTTLLEVHQLSYVEHKEDGYYKVVYNRVDVKNTTFTKQSLAHWFYQAGDLNKAKVLVSDFNMEVDDDFQEKQSNLNQSDIIKPYEDLKHWFAHDSLSITELAFLFMGVQPDAYDPKSISKSSLDEATRFSSMNALLIKAVGSGKLKGWLSIRSNETSSFTRVLYEATSGSNNEINPSKILIELTNLTEYLSPKRALYGEFYDYLNSYSIISEDKELHSLMTENEQLKIRIKELESQQSNKLNERSLNSEKKQNIEPSLSEYLPVKGEDIKTLSKAFQNYPTRFEHYQVMTITKISIQDWLKSAYACSTREQDVFANILLQHFLRSD